MSTFKIIISLLFLIITTSSNAQNFNITIDTVRLDIKSIASPASIVSMTHTVKQNGKYYCFFDEQGLYSYKIRERYFLIIAENGTILNNIELPAALSQTAYFDFFVRDGFLFAKTYMKHKSFYFDTDSLKWIEVNEVNDYVYEDEKYAIAYLNMGEWGETTWFIDKTTKQQYMLDDEGTIVNRLNNKYYLTNHIKVIEIENPKALAECNTIDYYEEVEEKEHLYRSKNANIGAKYLYQDTIYNYFDMKPPVISIHSSWVYNNQLYHLYSDSISMNIGQLKDGQFVSVQKLDDYPIYTWYYSYRGHNLDNHQRFLKFRKDNNTYGFVEIDGHQIHIRHFIHNQDSLHYLGTDNFEQQFKLLINNTLSIKSISDFETSIGGIDLKDNRKGIKHLGYFPKDFDGKDIQSKKIIKAEDKYITQVVEYFYNTKDNQIKAIFLEWEETEPYERYNTFSLLLQKDPAIYRRFQQKSAELKSIITAITKRKPQENKKNSYSTTFTWELENGKTIQLFIYDRGADFYELRMFIFFDK